MHDIYTYVYVIMQDLFQPLPIGASKLKGLAYSLDMRGRPSKNPRSKFGEQLFHAREQAGLSQQEFAKKLGVHQQDVARWERETNWVSVELLRNIAQTLNISVDELLGLREKKVIERPTGKARKLFEAVSKLPRRQQQKISDVVEALVNQHKQAA